MRLAGIADMPGYLSAVTCQRTTSEDACGSMGIPTFSDWAGPVYEFGVGIYVVGLTHGWSAAYKTNTFGIGPSWGPTKTGFGNYGITTLIGKPIYSPPNPNIYSRAYFSELYGL